MDIIQGNWTPHVERVFDCFRNFSGKNEANSPCKASSSSLAREYFRALLLRRIDAKNDIAGDLKRHFLSFGCENKAG